MVWGQLCISMYKNHTVSILFVFDRDFLKDGVKTFLTVPKLAKVSFFLVHASTV